MELSFSELKGVLLSIKSEEIASIKSEEIAESIVEENRKFHVKITI